MLVLPLLENPVVLLLPFLDLQNHLRGGVNLRGGVGEFATGLAVRFVGKTGTQPRIALESHSVTRARELWNDFRNESDASFTARNLTGDADQHALAFRAVMYGP